MAYFVGIDLGGTNIKAGVVTEKGELLNKGYTKIVKLGARRGDASEMALLTFAE